MKVELPNINDVFEKMEGVQSSISGMTKSIAEWKKEYKEEVSAAREKSSIDIFNIFVSALLQRAMRGEAYLSRIEVFKREFRSYSDITSHKVKDALGGLGYRFPSEGLSVVLAAKEIVTDSDFSWRSYFEEAERNYLDDYRKDRFLGIKGVGFKTRDFALSEFSNRFVAIDIHVARVTVRTGLIIHGHGDQGLNTSYLSRKGYLFFHDVIMKLSKETGWPEAGYSPGEIDRIFWFFGRAICKSNPLCQDCPAASMCLTGKR